VCAVVETRLQYLVAAVADEQPDVHSDAEKTSNIREESRGNSKIIINVIIYGVVGG